MGRDSIPERKAAFRRGDSGATGWSISASGLAAVWAEENSRKAILEAFRRREVYATTGPRIAVRVFGGWGFEPADLETRSGAEVGYARGVHMGGVLTRPPEAAVPSFLVEALKDVNGANLDRVQIVKGWIDAGGKTRERIYDVAWSEGRSQDAQGRLSPVGNTVDAATASYTNEIGSAQLSTVWRDPDFDPNHAAFYYVRVLEIPTPRHSVFDALALGRDPKDIEHPWWIQERAYTSPVWYRPDL